MISDFGEAELQKLREMFPLGVLRACWEMLIHHENLYDFCWAKVCIEFVVGVMCVLSCNVV